MNNISNDKRAWPEEVKKWEKVKEEKEKVVGPVKRANLLERVVITLLLRKTSDS